ncbi:MAG TPA: DMT family transporter [Prolixibacteraceae bacterium]|jgi:drug/metabolite transporter (DMT)-like permease
MKKYLSQTTLLAVIACLLWSSAFVGVKIGLKYHSPLQFAGIRFLISGLLLIPLVYNLKRFIKEVKANFGYVCLIAFLQVILQYTLFYLGVSLVPASISAMIVGSSPLFVALVAHFSISGDRMDWYKTGSILLGLVGVAVITLGRDRLPSGAQIALTGVILLLLNNLVSGITNVVVARKKQTISPMVLTSSSLFIGGLSLFIISIPIEGIQYKVFPAEYFVALGWLSFLSAAAITIWNTLLRRPTVKVSELNIWKFLIPVSGAILSWMILSDESPDVVSISGMILIASSLVILNIRNRRGKASIANQIGNVEVLN